MGTFVALPLGVVFLTPGALKGLSLFARSSHAAASAGMPPFIARSAKSKHRFASWMLATVAISSASVLVRFVSIV
jgi:hypothetical protein